MDFTILSLGYTGEYYNLCHENIFISSFIATLSYSFPVPIVSKNIRETNMLKFQ